MAKPKKSTATKNVPNHYCSLPEVQGRDLSHIADRYRLRLIAKLDRMWVNGTQLTYYFFKQPAQWRGGSEQEQAVRDAFAIWKNIGIGLIFREVDSPEEATIRIGFDHAEGSWSYVGRDCIDYASSPSERTTNFGWDLTTEYGKDTALHELGHVLGFPHEHQNPRAGIVWDEEKVYESLGGYPNYWSREQTHWNIIRKIPASTVDGSEWDKDSIMHYQFEAGLILNPPEYQNAPLIPSPGLSQTDIQTIQTLYPPLAPSIPTLFEYESQRITIGPGEQVDFVIKPTLSRKYTIQTFGRMDTVMVLFELRDGFEEYIDGDDDSGFDFNSKIKAHLHRGREYIVRTRLYFSSSQGSGSIMLY
ncbi:M12 family metallopeptidase [Alteromonas ponticola]|uniref:M12 family metallopeptidase n=1 Tax=Alteromonas aquimaris TaxID=2998417 RepID=A0ABT3PAH3_9ALTE|nr:matrixin family metalloprotease [Alteromonas aquimaris]MCW8109530.1 M12 family metallopeptidase [Alteromonas aquimaris]